MKNFVIVSILLSIGMFFGLSAQAETSRFNSAEANEVYQMAQKCVNENGYSQGDTIYSSKYSACLPRLQEILDGLGKENDQCLSQCVTNKPGSTNCDVCVQAYTAGGYTERTFSACDSFCVEKSPGLCGQCGDLRDQKKSEIDEAIDAAVADWQAGQKTVAPLTQNTSEKTTEREPKISTKTLAVGIDIKEGETVTTGKNEQAVIVFGDGSKVEIGANSSFTLLSKDEAQTLKGKFEFYFEKLVQGRTFRVKTTNAIAGVRGTKFSVDTVKNKTVVRVTEGTVAVSDAQEKKTVMVNAGYKVTVNRKKVGKVKRSR